MFGEQGYEVLVHEGIRPCKSWKEKLFINLSFGFLKMLVISSLLQLPNLFRNEKSFNFHHYPHL